MTNPGLIRRDGAFDRQQGLYIVQLFPAGHAVMDPPAVAAGIPPIDEFPRAVPYLPVDGRELCVRQAQHHGKRVVFRKNVAAQFFLFPVRDSPSVLVAVGKNDAWHGPAGLCQPLVELREQRRGLPAKGRHFLDGWNGLLVQHSFIHGVTLPS